MLGVADACEHVLHLENLYEQSDKLNDAQGGPLFLFAYTCFLQDRLTNYCRT